MLLPFRYCGGRGSIPKQREFSSPGLRSGASVWFPPYMHRYYGAEVFSVLSLVLSLILSPVRLFELGFSTHRLFKLGKLNTPMSFIECNFLCWVCTCSK